MKIQQKQDVSFLFTNLNKKNSGISAMTGLLGDYASIKNGSYGKLMRAYFKTEGSSEAVSGLAKDSLKKDSTEAKSIAKVQETASDLAERLDVLSSAGAGSIYEKDLDDIYDAVKSYIKDYNSALKAGEDTDNATLSSRVKTLATNTAMYEKDLSAIGITINKDSSLSIDKDTFMKSSVSSVQNIFQGKGSLGQVNAAQIDLIKMAASYEAARSGTYTFDATFSQTGTSGSLFDTLL